MSEHILLKHATKRKFAENTKLPNEAYYNEKAGCWLLNGSPLVNDKDFSEKNSTKKCDQETGEDQKGE